MTANNTSIKPVYADLRDKELGIALNKLKREKRAEVLAEGGSCLTCRYTKTAVGTMLRCAFKAKYVNMHSYCEHWVTEMPKGESK